MTVIVSRTESDTRDRADALALRRLAAACEASWPEPGLTAAEIVAKAVGGHSGAAEGLREAGLTGHRRPSNDPAYAEFQRLRGKLARATREVAAWYHEAGRQEARAKLADHTDEWRRQRLIEAHEELRTVEADLALARHNARYSSQPLFPPWAAWVAWAGFAAALATSYALTGSGWVWLLMNVAMVAGGVTLTSGRK